MTSLIECTDSYKLTHWLMYPESTTNVYSYFEARTGATYNETVFFGLQEIIALVDGMFMTMTYDDIDAAERMVEAHLGNKDYFNRAGWEALLELDYLPLRISAVPEGTPVPVGNVLMTVENTVEGFGWLVNYLETLLSQIWYPSTVATLSREVKKTLKMYLFETSDNLGGIDFMLHDFGFRGATSLMSAGVGGAAHLVNFKGTDTLIAMEMAAITYKANREDLGFSVPASEHSVMTALGAEGELETVDRLIEKFPAGILSVVADSYNIYDFVEALETRKEAILARDGVFVVRPDSITDEHKTPGELTVWIAEELNRIFGSTKNSLGYYVLDPHVRILWGDGIDHLGIEVILECLAQANFSAENIVFGMGGGLLQKVNRDTQRFAFKSSAQKRGGVWHDVKKNPLDSSKESKAGRLALTRDEDGVYSTVREEEAVFNLLVPVWEDGMFNATITFDEVRKNAAI